MPQLSYRLKKLNFYRHLARRNLSRRAFAREYGFNEVTVRKWASEKARVYPGTDSRRRLMEATGLPFDELFEEVQPD